MRNKLRNHATLILMIFLISSCSLVSNAVVEAQNSREYFLGQKIPGEKPKIFAEGIISTGSHEFDLSVSPAGTDICFVKPLPNYTIHHIGILNEKWTAAEIVAFSGRFDDLSPRFSSDGKKLFFSSNRSEDGKKDFNIWYTEITETGWSEPVKFDSIINSTSNELSQSFADNGTLYFQYFTTNGLKSDIYRSRFEKGHYLKPEKLNPNINTDYNEASPFISPDESYLLFHSDRPGGYGNMDLYISFRTSNNDWTEAINLGPTINTSASEGGPYLDPSGKQLFFSTYLANQKGYIYWVDSSIIDRLKSKVIIEDGKI